MKLEKLLHFRLVLVFQRRYRSEYISLYCMTKYVLGVQTKGKWTRNSLLLHIKIAEDSCAAFQIFFIRIFLFSTGLAPNCYKYMRFPVRLWLRWTSVVWQSEPVHLGEPVRTHIIICYRGVYYFTKPSEGTVLKWTNFSHIIALLEEQPGNYMRCD